MKRFFAVFLIFSFVMSACVPFALAADTVAEGSCGENLHWVLNADGVLTVSGVGAMEDYPAGAPWISYSMKVTSVVVQEGVTTIGNAAFRACSRVNTVSLPKSLTAIGDEAFRGCSAITSITVPEKTEKLGDRAFFACGALHEIQLPSGLAKIGGSAFESCTALKTVDIPESVTEIGAAAFRGCAALERMELPGSVKHVTASLFSECESLKHVMLGEGIESIASEAFYGCGLEHIVIPITVKTVYQTAFQECFALKTAEIAAGEVEMAAFLDCWALQSVTLGKTVKRLGKNVFGGCTSLNSVTFLGAKPELADNTFNEVTATVYYPEEKKNAVTWTEDTLQNYGGELTWVEKHDLAYIAAAEPTCAAPGCFAHWRCEACGKRFADADGKTEVMDKDMFLAALPHTVVVDAAVEPTCTEPGKTEGSHCSVCGEVLVAQKEIPAKGHSYANGVCTVCGAKDPDYNAPETPWVNPFKDVVEGQWYYEGVKFASQKGLFNGTAADTFSPNDPMTRGMLVTVLWRLDGKTAPKAAASFTDVDAKAYYAEAVAWASENGVVNGIGNNRFDPEGKVTREQIAAILYRYAEKKGIDVSKRADLSVFPDAASVSSYAREALSWAVSHELINGLAEGGKSYLAPQGNATRAQVATILARYAQNIVK